MRAYFGNADRMQSFNIFLYIIQYILSKTLVIRKIEKKSNVY